MFIYDLKDLKLIKNSQIPSYLSTIIQLDYTIYNSIYCFLLEINKVTVDNTSFNPRDDVYEFLISNKETADPTKHYAGFCVVPRYHPWSKMDLEFLTKYYNLEEQLTFSQYFSRLNIKKLNVLGDDWIVGYSFYRKDNLALSASVCFNKLYKLTEKIILNKDNSPF